MDFPRRRNDNNYETVWISKETGNEQFLPYLELKRKKLKKAAISKKLSIHSTNLIRNENFNFSESSLPGSR